jgi:hypothetical protein
MILHEIVYCSVRPVVVDRFRGRDDELAASAAVDSAIVVLVANAVDAAK